MGRSPGTVAISENLPNDELGAPPKRRQVRRPRGAICRFFRILKARNSTKSGCENDRACRGVQFRRDDHCSASGSTSRLPVGKDAKCEGNELQVNDARGETKNGNGC
uniref:Uncharacterized protein n=1 Tax=Trichuris muris TaxID=70415 RepID=A0A5S6QZA3_TRIMR